MLTWRSLFVSTLTVAALLGIYLIFVMTLLGAWGVVTLLVITVMLSALGLRSLRENHDQESHL